jgi:hypothetical protein
MVTLVFIVQLGLIYWLGNRTLIRPRLPAGGLTLRLAGPVPSELQTLNDPTLFVLPHPEGSWGSMRRGTPQAEFHPFEWSAPANHFPLAMERLGTVFSQVFQTSDLPALQLPAQLQAAPTLPDLPPLPVFAGQSVLQLEDGLAQRRLLAPLQLQPFTNADILANSVVRVGVDAGGQPVSATLLSRSGSALADQYALDKAWAARFEPLRGSSADILLKPTAHLSWGRMIFQWHTVPMPPASVTAASP